MKTRESDLVAEFTDEFGEPREVHRYRNGVLRVKQKGETVRKALDAALVEIVATRLRAVRLEKGMTMVELARRANIPGGKHQVHKLENPEIRGGCKMGTLFQLAEALGVGLDSLLPTKEEAMDAAGVRWSTDELGNDCLCVAGSK